MWTLSGASRRGMMGAFVASVMLVFSSLALVATAPTLAGAAQSPHGLTSPPTVTASTFQHTPSVDAPNTGNFTPYDVSCATSTFCVDVGYSYNGSGAVPLMQTWNGSSWSPVNLPTPAGLLNDSLGGVSCVSASFCEAVGYYRVTGSTPSVPVALVWNGSTWANQIVPLPSGQTSEVLDGVSCLSTTWCLATGSAYTGSFFAGQATSALWNGTNWTIVATAALPPALTGDFSYLNGVSCTTASWCMAVGGAFNGSFQGPDLKEVWNGSSWSIAPTTGAAGGFTTLGQVSCVGPQFCSAVGYTYTSPDNAPLGDSNLAEQWNGSSWSVVATPDLGGGNGDDLSGVSCFAATGCSAVGIYATDNTGNHFQDEALSWNGQSWSEATPAKYQISNTQSGPTAGLTAVDCLSDWACMAVGTAEGPSSSFFTWNMMAPIARSGYRFVARDGGIFNYGAGAPFLGSLGGTVLNAPVVGMGVMPAGDGYYLVAADGGVFNYGSAKFYGSMGGIHLNKPIVGMAVTPDGGGYWLVASDGGIFAFGDALFFGSTGAITLNKPVVGMAAAPNGKGYWLVATDGGVFNYGSAAFWGSTGGTQLNKPIVGIGATSSGQYYLVASDGGIFAFPSGAAGPPFDGSTGAIALNKPIIGMTVVANGYYLSGSDGGIFSFPSGPAGPPFDGSTGGTHLNAPIVGVAS